MGRCSWGLLMEVLLGVKAIPWLARFDVVGGQVLLGGISHGQAHRTRSLIAS